MKRKTHSFILKIFTFVFLLLIALIGSNYWTKIEEIKELKSEFNKSYVDSNGVLNLAGFTERKFENTSFPGVFEIIQSQGIGFDGSRSDWVGTNPEITITNYQSYQVENDSIFTKGFLYIGKYVKVAVPIMFNDKVKYEGVLTNCKPKIYRDDVFFLECNGGTIHQFNINRRDGFKVFRLSLSSKHLKSMDLDGREHSFRPEISIYVVTSGNNEILIFNELDESGLEHPVFHDRTSWCGTPYY